MYGIASSLVLLLFIGVHNSWDVAVSITTHKHRSEKATQGDRKNEGDTPR
jgi:hypothetical protein